MAEDFDPYHKWLGIPPHEQPPNHYRLLGLNLFEPNLDVVASASDRQMAFLRSFQAGPQRHECQRLLNEVSAARIVLLDVKRRAVYDQALHESLSSPHPSSEFDSVPLTPADMYLPASMFPNELDNMSEGASSLNVGEQLVVRPSNRRLRYERRRRVRQLLVAFFCLAASAICVLALYFVLQTVATNRSN